MSSSRRDFLKASVLASSLLFVPTFLHALDARSLPGLRQSNGRRLVVVQLGGGNDGLNTVVPYRNDLYYNARPTLGLRPQSGLLTLTDELALHPAMTGLNGLYDQGQVAILNSVGYPNPDRSHFRAMDIWHSASGSDEYLTTGWLGRYLDASCPPGGGQAYQGLEIDDTLSLAMKGRDRKGLALRSAATFHQLTQSNYIARASQTYGALDGGTEVDFLYKTLAQTTASAEYLYQTTKVYQSAVTYPNTAFSKNLRTTTELINSGVNTRVFYVSLPGFDTHVRQQAQQGKLLGELSAGLAAFTEDLRKAGNFDDTLVLVFSEFGRRVTQNASNGTDHGTANIVLLLGGNLRQQGILNAPPDLQNLLDGDLRHQLDFRSLYATLLHDWLGADDEQILGRAYSRLPGLF